MTRARAQRRALPQPLRAAHDAGAPFCSTEACLLIAPAQLLPWRRWCIRARAGCARALDTDDAHASSSDMTAGRSRSGRGCAHRRGAGPGRWRRSFHGLDGHFKRLLHAAAVLTPCRRTPDGVWRTPEVHTSADETSRLKRASHPRHLRGNRDIAHSAKHRPQTNHRYSGALQGARAADTCRSHSLVRRSRDDVLRRATESNDVVASLLTSSGELVRVDRGRGPRRVDGETTPIG